MKKIINSIFLVSGLLASGLMVNSCRDALEVVQPDVILEENIFASVKSMTTYYNGSIMNNLEPSNEMYVGAVLTDEVKPGIGSGGQEFAIHRYFIDPSTPLIQTIWYQNYRVINRVNRLIQGSKDFVPASATEKTQFDTLIAQARAVRAYCFLQLQTYYSTNMADPNALGVIVFDNVPENPLTANLPRSTNAEVYTFMNADLDYARSILAYGPASTAASTPQYNVDKAFVNAVSARLNLYRGRHDLAKTYAQDIIANAGVALTPATPITSDASGTTVGSATWNTAFYGGATGLGASFNPYRNIWNDTRRGEVIFSLGRPVGAGGFNMPTRWNTNTSTRTGSPMWNWGRNLFNIFYNTDGDIRRYAYVDPTSLIDPNYLTSTNPRSTDILVVDKYPGKTGSALRNDLKLFRLSEMYFILAECAVKEGAYAVAAGHIQSVRVARNYKGTATTPAYTSDEVAYRDILKERRVELALEGHRYIDLKRLANLAGVTMDRNQTDDDIAVTNLPNDSYKYTFPIPLNEVSANPNVQQNAGY